MARIRNKRQSTKQAEMPLGDRSTALYIRVSTDKQADEGYSLDDQKERLEAFCEAQDWTVGAVYADEGISGKTDDRPQFLAMMAAAKSGEVGRIVAIKLDRLARNTRDFLATVDRLDKAGCDLVLLKESFDTGTPHGKFALTMFAAIAELEASQIAERTMSGRRQKAKQGGYNGGRVPLGYDYDGEAFALNEHAETVAEIFDRFTTPAHVRNGIGYGWHDTLSSIADDLNERGIRTQRNGKWYPATVRYILNNGFYAGLVQYEDSEVPGSHPAIIEPETYQNAIARLRALRPGPP